MRIAAESPTHHATAERFAAPAEPRHSLCGLRGRPGKGGGDAPVALWAAAGYSTVIMVEALLLNSGKVLIGLLLLYFGGDYLVSGASALARKLEIPIIVVGLTVVAFGTSAPELFVSLVSAFQGLMPVSVGNVVGSNIINIALILGLASLLRPIGASRKIIFVDIPIMFAAYAVLLLATGSFEGESFWRNGKIWTFEGITMVGLLAIYLFSLYRYGKRKGLEELEEIDVNEIPEKPTASTWVLLLKIAAGIAGLAVGAQLLVTGASWIADELFGVSERFIGITVVALGTSLPELVTSVLAAAKREMEISLGNIVGSNIFNSLMVLGATSLVRNIEIGNTSFEYDFYIMAGISLILFGTLAIARRLTWVGGVLLLCSYAGYFVFLLETRNI